MSLAAFYHWPPSEAEAMTGPRLRWWAEQTTLLEKRLREEVNGE